MNIQENNSPYYNQFHRVFLICSYIDCDIRIVFFLYCSGCRRCMLKICFLWTQKPDLFRHTNYKNVQHDYMLPGSQLCTSVNKANQKCKHDMYMQIYCREQEYDSAWSNTLVKRSISLT